MFEKLKKRILGEPLPSLEQERFPKPYEGREISSEEFRKILEEEKPQEVYVRYTSTSDYGAHGRFYVRLKDNTVLKTDSPYPMIDPRTRNIMITENSPVGVLDNLPYHEISYGQNFADKFVLIKDIPNPA